MGFSGGGSSQTRAHTHDSTIVNDGGSLNLNNITQGGAAMTAGAITYSDGPAGHMQVLTAGAAGDKLEINPAGTAPQWASGAAAHDAGMLVCWAGAVGNIPAGWLLCDGASIATATYADLHTAIGYVYGGAGANFNLPNLVNRFVRGQSTQTAATGGADSVTLTTTEMPSHTHTVSDPGHTHAQRLRLGGGGSYDGATSSATQNSNTTNSPTANNTTGITNSNTGGGGAFDNRPAYIEMQYIIKT